MEINITINEAGAGREKQPAVGEGRRAGRGDWRGHRQHEGAGGRHRGRARWARAYEAWESEEHRQQDNERPTARGRVIGKVVELPDGQVKIVSREGTILGHGQGQHRNHEQCEGRPRHNQGAGRRPHRHHRDESDEAREARRARRRLVREIVHALEESGYNKA